MHGWTLLTVSLPVSEEMPRPAPCCIQCSATRPNCGRRADYFIGGFCVICTFFVYFCIYETKGLSLEQVDELYAKVSHAWKSPGFVPSVNFQEVKDVKGSDDGRRHTLAELETAAVRRRSSAGNGAMSYTEKV